MKEEFLDAFFNRQKEYYKAEYNLIDSGKILSFNVGAFFGGIVWFLYRKLYWQAGIFVIVIFAISISENVLYSRLNVSPETQGAISFIVTFLFTLLVGFLGNFIYINHVKKKITKITNKYLTEDQQLAKIKIQGGVSFLGLFIAIGASIFFIWVILAYS